MKKIEVTSSAFEHGGKIPSKYTCDGVDISPPLKWDSAPEETKSIAVICDDPDAPMGTWVHWVIYNIPHVVTELPENIHQERLLRNKSKQGINDFRRIGYGGPCPPRGSHRYFFKVYALDTVLELEAGIKKEELVRAMEGHILASGEIMGNYSR